MIPEKFNVKLLKFCKFPKGMDGHYVRLIPDRFYPPILYTSNPLRHEDVKNFFDVNGFRIVGTLPNCPEFSKIYEQNHEEYKQAILKLLVKEML